MKSIIIAALLGAITYEEVQAIDITHHHKHHHKAHHAHKKHHHRRQSLVQDEEPVEAAAAAAPPAPAPAKAALEPIDSADRTEKEADPVLEAAKT